MTGAILTLNAGSSSLKFALFSQGEDGLRKTVHGQVEGLGSAPHMIAKDANGVVLVERRWASDAYLDHEAFLRPVLALAEDHLDGATLDAIGHRIVHGGLAFRDPVVIDADILSQLDALIPLAPLHQPHNLAAVRAAQAARPGLPQVACFDTAFHAGHPEVVTHLALPPPWHAQGVRRYGFHGLSYEFVAGRLRALDPVLASGRVIIAHLGNGASLCAVKGGVSVDTTMGFTALDGLIMGTRCGNLDPGVILYLQQQAGLSVEAVQDLLYNKSGLLGVSGLSSDMRVLLASDDPNARTAVDLFVFRIVREIGALTASMGGLDGVVFTAGIGENAAEIRARVAERLAWMGAMLDPQANRRADGLISSDASPIKILVVPTDEEVMIARHTHVATARK
ncbi:acetate kinase [soil metagenome]